MRRLIVLSIVLILLGSVFANARRTVQEGDAKIVLKGTVYDTNHAVIASSRLLVRSLEGREYSTTTSGEGSYKFELPPGTYKIEANAEGFCPKRMDLFRVRDQIPKPLDFILDVQRSNRPCAQKTMIKEKKPTRKPEIFRSIAE